MESRTQEAVNHQSLNPRGSALRILVVEDHEDTANTLAMLLRLYGYQVEVAADGTVTQKINGQPTIVYSAVQLDPEGRMANSKPLIEAAGGKVKLDGGYISLQSEGHPIEFRNIEIMELK